MHKIGLYIHVPFCSGKCPYCDFFSVAADSETLDRYTEFTCEKLRSLRGDLSADTVYFGGGTPSLLGTERLCRILSAAEGSFGKPEECTIEVNPRSAMQLDFKSLASHGVNRVSMGLQSGSDEELSLLGRRHTVKEAAAAADKIRSEGISNLSLDLMLGISRQTFGSLSGSIDLCSELGASHISAYMLTVEKGTPYYNQRSSMSFPDEDTVCELYEYAVNKLSEYGYSQYEISNFSKPGLESRHNLKYWRCEEYLGLGPAAHSFIDGRRFYYPRSLQAYYEDKQLLDGEGGGREEYIALALRLKEGLRFGEYQKRFGEAVPGEMKAAAERLVKTGLLTVGDDYISLTTKGFLVSNSVIGELLDF